MVIITLYLPSYAFHTQLVIEVVHTEWFTLYKRYVYVLFTTFYLYREPRYCLSCQSGHVSSLKLYIITH